MMSHDQPADSESENSGAGSGSDKPDAVVNRSRIVDPSVELPPRRRLQPRHLGRVRVSTMMLAAAWIGLFIVYLVLSPRG